MYENWKVLKKDIWDYPQSSDTITRENEENPYQKEYSKVVDWCNESGQYSIVDDGEYYKVEKIPEPTEEEKAARVRETRDSYLKTYVDPIVTNPLRMEDMSEEELNEIKAYRQYLLDIPQSTDFPNISVMTFDEWKSSQVVKEPDVVVDNENNTYENSSLSNNITDNDIVKEKDMSNNG